MAKKAVEFEIEVNRKLFEKVRKMDHNTLRIFVNEIYSKGVKAGKEAAEGLKPEEVRQALLSMKGIGEKKADAIIEVLSKTQEMKEKGAN